MDGWPADLRAMPPSARQRGVTVLDVSAAAREQMRTARAALEARAFYLAAQDASYKAYLVRQATESAGGEWACRRRGVRGGA